MSTNRPRKDPRAKAGRAPERAKAVGTRRHRRRLRVDPGAAPGTLRIDPTSPPPRIEVIAYGPDAIEEHTITAVSEIGALLGRHAVTWINVDGLGDADLLRELAALFQLHPLALEDVAHTNQRPKVEVYEGACFFIARMPYEEGLGQTEQISIFLGRDWVLSFQEFPGDCFDPVRARIRAGGSRLRTHGPDYLAYALLDSLVDSFLPLVDSIEDRLEAIEARILERPEEAIIQELHGLRRAIEPHRRAVRSYREMFGSVLREKIPFIRPETEVFFRDCHDHAVLLIDLLDGTRETASGLVELYMSSMSNRMNEVMKVLTITATIFIPMTFVAGVYGMNFDPDTSPLNLPELRWYWGYPFAWSVMLAMGAGLLIYFRRKGWIGPVGRSAPRHGDPTHFGDS